MGYTPNTLRWVSRGLQSNYDTPNSLSKQADAYERYAEHGPEFIADMDRITVEEAIEKIKQYKAKAAELRAKTWPNKIQPV